jgi:hypothetical protein
MKVGVFPYRGKIKVRYMAYTVWYDPRWRGCCEHHVLNVNRTAAKKLAIQQHIERCAATKDEALLKAIGE